MSSPGRWVIPMLVNAAVVGALLTAVTFASIPDADGIIHGCVTNRSGALRVIDPPGQQCGSKETPVDWDEAGASGDAGYYTKWPHSALPASPDGVFNHSPTVVVSLQLPAGSYLLSARAGFNLSSFFEHYIECVLGATGFPEIDRLDVHPPYISNFGDPDREYVTFTGAVTLGQPGTADLRCRGNQSVGAGGWVYAPSLTATRLGAVQIQPPPS